MKDLLTVILREGGCMEVVKFRHERRIEERRYLLELKNNNSFEWGNNLSNKDTDRLWP